MSVAFFIIQEDGSFSKETVPVATQHYFRKTWLNLGNQLKLKYIPLFVEGATFTGTDLPLILEELEILHAACLVKFNDEEPVFERINLLKEKLLELKNENQIHFFIG